jgi:hypothetical protein
LISGVLYFRLNIREAIRVLGRNPMKQGIRGQEQADFQLERALLLIHTEETIEKGGSYR